ncbi:MAG TPA: amidase [Mycobacteriales bacterium]|nr:amidase [Mycobacteriales bacterium]
MDAWLDGVAQAELVRKGHASPRELVDAAIDRIEALDPQLNAVVHRRFESARDEALSELPHGPFRGVPILVKDELAMTGEPLTYGSRVMKDAGFRADHDSYVAQKLRAAGFVVLGRTNMPELAVSVTTEPEAYGATHNPWDLTRSAGGSSGGAGAAVAAGMVPIAHASDSGGSIRIPAAHCGLVGLKPTRGRISLGPKRGEAWGSATVKGCVSRTVRDTAAMLDVLAGPMPGDPHTPPAPVRPYADEVGADAGRLRVGLLDHPANPDVPGDPECAAAVQAAGALLSSLGHHVEPAWPDAMGEPDFTQPYATLLAVEMALELEGMSEMIGRPIADDELEPLVRIYPAMGRAIDGPRYLRARRWLETWTRRFAAWWTDFDLLVMPVLNAVPPPLGYVTDPVEGFARLLPMVQYTAQANVSGQPSISLPLHWSPDGLPVGVQLMGAFGREDLLLRVAAQLEQAAPWAQRRPPVSA